MIEGMFVYLVGIATGVVALLVYNKKNVNQVHQESKLFDESKYLTPDKKYFTSKSLDDEGGK